MFVKAKGEEVDFVSHCFYRQSGVNEDPVTSSAYTIMSAYCSGIFNKTKMKANQLSKRKGF